jgi:hypothetical protein
MIQNIAKYVLSCLEINFKFYVRVIQMKINTRLCNSSSCSVCFIIVSLKVTKKLDFKTERKSQRIWRLPLHYIANWGAENGAQVCHSGAVGWVTVLQAGRSWVRLSMVSLESFIDMILPAALWSWGRLSLQKKWVPGIFPGGIKAAFVYRLSWNLGASTSWNPQGLYRDCFTFLIIFNVVR